MVDECQRPSIARPKLEWWRHEGQPDCRRRTPAPGQPGTQDVSTRFTCRRSKGCWRSSTAWRWTCSRPATSTSGPAALLLQGGQRGRAALRRIFGYPTARPSKYAHDLGIAFQLTNIIRDVGGTPAAPHLPADRRTPAVRGAGQGHPRSAPQRSLSALMKFQAERAEKYYDQAFAQLPACDRKTQRPGLVMSAIYRTLLKGNPRGRLLVLDRRTSLTPLRKVWLASTTLAQAHERCQWTACATSPPQRTKGGTGRGAGRGPGNWLDCRRSDGSPPTGQHPPSRKSRSSAAAAPVSSPCAVTLARADGR